MKNNVAIITLYGLENYGNRLQNYALQKVLQSFGYNVTTIAVVRNSIIKSFIKRKFEICNGKLKLRSKSDTQREKAFRYFTKKLIKTRYLYRIEGFIDSNIGTEYDVFVVGSDQVWNPLFWENINNSCELNNYLLSFTDNKKIAYAASFGVSDFDDEWKAKMIPLLKRFDYISIRESEGVELAKSMEIDSSLVLDPTLLLDAEEWKKIEDNKVKKNEKYVLYYFLGEKPETVYNDNIENIIDLMEPNDEYYSCGPETFVELIDKAEIVYTDSFHAVVFSILMNTPFRVYKRQHRNNTDMSGRITTLLSMIGIKDYFDGKNEIIYPNRNEVNMNLEDYIEKSKQFLRNALIEGKDSL